jgi:hypothetical protein
MDNIVDINSKLEQNRRQKQFEQYREKIKTLQRIVQCSSCHFKCSMCGKHLHHEEDRCGCSSLSTELIFCDSCQKEYEDFLAIAKDGKDPELFWQNEAWVQMWTKWLSYRHAIAQFLNSNEFQDLMEEIERQA